MAHPSITWADEDRFVMERVAELVQARGLYGLLDIDGLREPLVRWFKEEIRARYAVSMPLMAPVADVHAP